MGIKAFKERIQNTKEMTSLKPDTGVRDLPGRSSYWEF